MVLRSYSKINLSLIVNNKLTLPTRTNDTFTTTKPQIYYNTLTKKYMIYDTTNVYELQNNTGIINKNVVFKLQTSNASVISYINSESINPELPTTAVVFLLRPEA